MKKTITLLVLACFTSLSNATQTRDEVAAPIIFDRLGERALIVKAGEIYPDQIVALVSQKGLVVIDTGVSPTLTRRYRKIIEGELGRNDFAWVINTHHHFDHTNGNQVFSDAVIVGHDRCPEAMRRFEPEMANFIAGRRERYRRRAGWLQGLDPSSPMAGRLRDLVFMSRMMCDDMENSFVVTPPSLTFNDRLTLDLGDMTLKLIYFGSGFHSDNDVIAHVPELGLVFTGDLLRAYESTSMVTSEGDIKRWVDVLNEILENGSDIEHIVTIHAGILPPERLVSMRDALVNIYNEVERKESGVVVLSNALTRTEGKEAVEELRKIMREKSDQYYFLEGDITEVGNRLLDENRTEEAVTVFELNTEMFPRSVDAHDWLGSAYMSAGRKEEAIRSFERSLELFPLNSGAYDMLKMLENQP